jgi:CheY-like chemotaxis protein
MRILIAEDELVSRCMLEDLLTEWGHDVVAAQDGLEALQALQTVELPRVAILDWSMPGMEGIEVCRKVRELPTSQPPYIILLTAKEGRKNIVAGLEAGANDYLAKPFDPDELRARLNVGIGMVEMEQRLNERVQELEQALAHVKQLQGFLPICCYCKKVRDDHNYWHQVEAYIADHTGTTFSHGICPPCLEKAKKSLKTEQVRKAEACVPA